MIPARTCTARDARDSGARMFESRRQVTRDDSQGRRESVLGGALQSEREEETRD